MCIARRFRTAGLAVAVLLSIPSVPTPAAAQETAPAAEAPAVSQPASPTAGATQTLRRTAEPASSARVPRTLRAYWHVFIAFAVAWVLLFGYALSLGRRFRRLEGEIDALAKAA